jgi:hypothetical protein
MNTERKPRERHYVTKAKVRQYVEAARELGIDVGGFEVTPNGAIRVFSEAAFRKAEEPEDEYEKWFRRNPA